MGWCLLTGDLELVEGSGELLPLGVSTDGVVGALILLSIGHSHGIASRIGPWLSRPFVSLGLLALSALIPAFSGEEAQAQQLPQAQRAETDEQAAGTLDTLPDARRGYPYRRASPQETRLARTTPVEPASQPALVRPGSPTEEPSPTASGPALAEPGLPMGDALPDPEPVSGSALRTDPVPGLTTVPAEQDNPSTPVDLYLALPDPRSTTSESATELVTVAPIDQETAPAPVDPHRSPLDLELEPVAIEERIPSRC